MKKMQVLPDGRKRITTPEHRQQHIAKCRQRDAANHAKHGGCNGVGSDDHYEKIGDIATHNTNIYHNSVTGHHSFYADTPLWIVAMAVQNQWASWDMIERNLKIEQVTP